MTFSCSNLFYCWIFLLLTTTSNGQQYYEEALPQRLSNYSVYQKLVLEQEVIREKVRLLQGELNQRIPSETVRLALHRALGILPESRNPQIALTISVLKKQGMRNDHLHLDSFINTDAFFQLEHQAIQINRDLDQLAFIFQYQEGFVDHTVPQLKGILEEELTFYGIQDGERIGEIGSGEPSFACALTASYQNLQLYLNEVAPLALVQLRYHQLYNPMLQTNNNRVWVIEGSDKSTGLEGQKLDKVIVRNALHHFSEPEAMLQSIRLSLKPEGALFIKEKFVADCQRQCCELLLGRQQLYNLLNGQHFEQVDSTVFQDQLGETWWLFQYRKQVN